MKYSKSTRGYATGNRREQLRRWLAGAHEDGHQRAWLSCAQKHKWTTEIDPGSEDRAGVVDAHCPTCGEFYSMCRLLRVTLDEAVECRSMCGMRLSRNVYALALALITGLGRQKMATQSWKGRQAAESVESPVKLCRYRRVR